MPGKALNAFAASGALLAALARFAEYWLGSLGAGDYLEEALPFPFAVSEVWNPDFPEYYLAVFMLEGLLSLRVALFALRNREDSLTPSVRKTMRGSGDHQRMGWPWEYQGKMPWR